jgi:UDP:flavonoid glycosyltransferase YjiC (YdhE family)
MLGLVYSHCMRAILAGGGTGGHVIPALAIANELKKSYGAEVLFIGTARGIENRLVPAAGYPLQAGAGGSAEERQPDDAGEDGVRFAARGVGARAAC